MLASMLALDGQTLNHDHERELIAGSGIDPAIIQTRGYVSATADDVRAAGFAPSQCRAGMLIPQWTLAGVQVGWSLKPDDPRIDEKDGKPLKYESPFGSVLHLDMHPDAQPALRDPNRAIYFTEGSKKADAAWSRGLPCVSLVGVWTFVRGRLVVPDLDEIPLKGRRVRVVFDSDVTRKESVAEALLRFCAALSRRGARVEVVYLPEGPDGAKVGLDDYFVAGGTVAELDALAVSWDGRGPGVTLRGGGDEGAGGETIDDVRHERDAARADVSALAQTFLNPNLTHAQKIAVVSAATQAIAKREAGKIEPDGRVVLSPSEIADDWRPEPERGGHVAPVNKTGSKPRMPRSSVGPIFREAVELGLISAERRGTIRRRDNGTTYKDWEWIFDPAASLAALLDPWATWRPEQPKARKQRESRACPHCHEVHAVERRDHCTGCGAQIGDPRIIPAPMPEKNSDIQTPRGAPPPPSPVRIAGKKFRHGELRVPEEPAWLADAPDRDIQEDDDDGDAVTAEPSVPGRPGTRVEHQPDPWNAPLTGFERPAPSFHFSAD